ncbi:MAG: ribonuclease P protein component [Deltaproteobacteria bacterium]|nr:ribonuclease P protein component [Deltaproteobacteria bacterium]
MAPSGGISEAGSFRFPKGARLASRKVIREVFRQGGGKSLGVFQVRFLSGAEPQSRFLISIKRKGGSSPQRNRAKRLLREAFRKSRHQLAASWDICFYISKPLPGHLTAAQVETEVRTLFAFLNRQSPTTGKS